MPAKKTSKKAPASTAKNILDSANQIWLAGMGAFAKAQEEGNRFFDRLVSEGADLEEKTRTAAESTVSDVREAVEDTVEQMQSRANHTWNKLESVFEKRVSRALASLGMPTADEISELTDRVNELSKQVQQLNRAQRTAGARQSATKKKVAKKTAKKTAKKAAKKKVAKKATPRRTKKKAAKKKTSRS